MRRMCEGALKCALRDFRREELTLRWAGQDAASEESVGTESFGQARGTAAYCQLCLSCCTLPRHQPAAEGAEASRTWWSISSLPFSRLWKAERRSRSVG